MEAIKKIQYNIGEAFYYITDRFPGLIPFVITVIIIAEIIR